MSLLKQIRMDGEVLLDYAWLTVEYTFANTEDDAVIPRYVFPTPRGGKITGLQVLNEERQLVRAKLFPLREAGLTAGDIRLTQMASDLYCLEGKILNQEEECRILMELFLPLARCGDHAQLIVPLGIAGIGKSGEACPVEVNLYLDGKVIDSSHSVDCHGDNVSAQILSGRDFVLTVAGKRESTCLVQETWGESIGVYRLFSQNPAAYRREKKKRVLLLLDSAWSGEERLSSAVRELCFRALQALPEGTPVQVMAGSWEMPVFADFVPATETTHQTLLSALPQIPSGGTVRELLCRIAGRVSKDTLVILFSAGKEMTAPLAQGLPPIHLVTVGNAVCTPLGSRWGSGEHLHCYPEDVPKEKMETAVIRWLCPSAEVEVTVQSGAQDLLILKDSDIAEDGYLDVVLRTSGQAPTEFLICQDKMVKETVAVTKGKRMEHLPIAGQLYGRAKCLQLERLLMRTDWGSYQAIKQQMEAISLRYGVLTQETVLGIEQPDRVGATVVTCSLADSCGFERPTIFGETLRSVRDRQDLVAKCLEVLARNIRADGGIYQGVEERAEQTAYAMLALSMHKEKDRAIASVLRNIESYLRPRELSGTAGFLYTHREELSRQKEVLLHHIPSTEALLTQELTVTTASQLLLHLS